MGKRYQAFYRLESVEYYATILMYTGYIIERQNTLSSSQVERLLEIEGNWASPREVSTCAGVNEADVQGQRRSSMSCPESLNLKGNKACRPGTFSREQEETVST